MKDFGFKINKDRQIDYDKLSHKLYNDICVKEPDIKLCIACGTCAATCSVNKFSSFSLRKIIQLVQRGDTHNLNQELEKCMLCGKCILVCPREINTRNLLLTIKKEIYSSHEV